MYGWFKKPSVASQKVKAERERQKLRKNGRELSSVVIQGRTIARTFWGKAWCGNLERYSDFENRLPRGRSYVTNGFVLDLQITPGRIEALVSGTRLYTVVVTVNPLPAATWAAVCADCAGGIASVVELLQGRFSSAVMERLCRPGDGLFPKPAEIQLSCSCPDWADLCKHVAAVLYGIGARLDHQPELLFRLRQVNQEELVAAVAGGLPLVHQPPPPGRLLADGALAELFGAVLNGEHLENTDSNHQSPSKDCPPTIATPAVTPRRGASKTIQPTATASQPVGARRVQPTTGTDKGNVKTARTRERNQNLMAGGEPKLWEDVDALIATRQPASYRRAIVILSDLRDLAARGDGDVFRLRLDALHQLHARKATFIELLKKAGFSAP